MNRPRLIRIVARCAVCLIVGCFTELPFGPAGSPALRAQVGGQLSESQDAREERWKKLMQRRKDVFADLRKIRQDLTTTPFNQASKLYSQQTELNEQLEKEINPQLLTLAKQLYAKKPENVEYAYFALHAAIEKHHYTEAAKIADRMIDSRQFNKEVFQLASRSHFASHQFTQARQYLDQLKQLGALAVTDQELLDDVDQYGGFWSREQALRRQEARATEPLRLPRVVLKTSRGEIELELFENEAPDAVNAFVHLIESGKYNESTIEGHRDGYITSASRQSQSDKEPLIPKLKPGGDPNACECYAEIARKHFRGSLSLECFGKRAYGSVFQISLKPIPSFLSKPQPSQFGLPPSRPNTVCGRVLRGMECVELLVNGGAIQSARVVHKRDHKYEPHRLEVEKHEPSLAEQGKLTEAVAEARKKYQRLAKQRGEEDTNVLAARNELGLTYLAQGNFGEARNHFQEIFTARKGLLGDRHASTAEALNNLGVAIYRAGNFEAAHKTHQQAFAIRQEVLGKDHADTLQSACNLLLVQNVVGKGEDDWQLHNQVADDLLQQIGEHDASRASADAVESRLARIAHPMLQLEFAFPAGLMDRLGGKAIPPTRKTARLLMRLGMISYNNEDFELATAVCAEVFGPKHPQTALALVNLAAAPNYPFVRPHLVSEFPDELRIARLNYAVNILQTSFGDQHLHTAAAHHNLGISLLSDPLRREQGREHLLVSHKIVDARLGKHPRTAVALEAMGLAAYLADDNFEAADHLRAAYEMRRETLGVDHFLTAAALNSYGAATFQNGDYPTARQSIEHALDIRRRTLGFDSNDTILSLNDLGVVLQVQGDYLAARQYLEHAVELVQQLPPEQQRALTGLEDNLWVVRLELGDFVPARRHLEKVLKENPNGLFRKEALAKLATLCRKEGRVEEAQRHLKEALAIEPNDASLLNDLGAVSRELGQLDAAGEYFASVLAIREQLGEDHPDVAFSLTSLALLDQKRGNYEDADKRLQQALAVYHKSYGPRHPRTTDVQRMIGETALLAGDLAKAPRHLDIALASKLALAADILPTLSEAEGLAFVTAFKERDLLLELHRRRRDDVAAYEVVWKTRSLATRALSARRRFLTTDPETRDLEARLHGIRKRLAALILLDKLPVYVRKSEGGRKQQLLKLTEDKERLERKIASVKGTSTNQELTLTDFFNSLPKDLAVVDIVRNQRRAIGENAAESYEAFVLSRKQVVDDKAENRVVRVALGQANEIDVAIEEWRKFIQRQGGADEGKAEREEKESPASKLRRQVWEKLEPHFENCKTVVVVPAGAMARLPWHALPGKKPHSYLVEDYAIATVVYPQQIPLLSQSIERDDGRRLLVGGVDYNADHDTTLAASEFLPLVRPAGKTPWKKLPGTLDEIDQIAQIRDESEIVRLESAAATESRIEQELPRSRYVHLATHGFFAGGTSNGSSSTSTSRNPLVLSGIVLAGANNPPTINAFGVATGNDGLMTAEEITGLDLSNTELVVLSSCESGLGEVAGSEGVFGLQRAFALSGARSVVGSLWSVSDHATKTLMIEFYRNLWDEKKKMGKLEALRQAQLTMLKRYDPKGKKLQPRGIVIEKDQKLKDAKRLPPHFWAAFVLSGDWQ